ncbi:MAG: helix-turn-helix transcriptional regulator [Prevotella sp.]|nr:helix-turn-helix transcriptional regulator [Prevotella sp.]
MTLKPEEKQILTLSAQGYTMKEIAGQMLRSFDTVKFYRRQIFEKLDVQNITEALSLATSYCLVLAVIPTVLTYFVTQMGNFSSPRCRITHLGSRFIWQFAYFCEPARHLRTIENHRESNSLESSAFCRKFASENFQT